MQSLRVMMKPLVAICELLLGTAIASGQVADRTTLNGKVMPGYQGWFSCPGDGNPGVVGWRHWSRSTASIGPNLYTVDLWPEVSEYSTTFNAPGVTLLYGGTASLFSSVTPSTVSKHFEWMRNAGIDGVFFQRFLSELGDPTFFALRNTVLQKVSAAANMYGRTWALEYDISGSAESTLYTNITNDWIYLSNTYNIRNDPRYLYHNAKPVIVIWGLGFTDRPGTPTIASQIINFFKNDPTYGGCTCIGGVPATWRTLTGSSKTDPAWATTYRSWDVINPWTVGAYNNSASITNWKNNVAGPDVTECTNLGITYLPVAWPGFSWDNLMQLPPGTSGIDRRDGQHLWDQVYAYESLPGVNKLFVAMFDECDEGTAIFKISDNVPNTNHWVDNNGFPQDWYMRLAGAAGQAARGEIGLTPTIPISSPLQQVFVDLGCADATSGIKNVLNADGNTSCVTIGGRECRRPLNPGAGDYYFYFDVSDAWAYQGSKPDLYISMEYYDSGTSTITLQYDSSTGTGLPAYYRYGGSVTQTNTNTWKCATFHVTDAYFGDRQNAGADFRLGDVGDIFYLNIIRVNTQAPVPPVIAPPNPACPQITYPGIAYMQQWTLIQDGPATAWSLLQAPSGAQIDAGGLVSGWTPGAGNFGDNNLCVQATNCQGSDTTCCVVRVLSRLDFDKDGDVDADDINAFKICGSGAGVPLTPGCESKDVDHDGDVDMDDFAIIQRCYGGANLPASPNCAN